jgi:hypothetical protein
VNHREFQLSRELGGLVEAACSATPRMERHRNHAVRVGEDRRPALTHQHAELDGEGMPPVEFQEMDELSECPLVGTDGPETRDRRAMAAAARAALGGGGGRPLKRERVTTVVA